MGSLRVVFKKGSLIRGQYFSLKYHVNFKRKTYRLAIVVSRKVHKSAVVRNKIRRRIYEQIRLNESKINKPYDLVITVFSEEVANMPSDKLSESIKDILKKAEVI